MTNSVQLTKSPLLDLLGRKSKSREEFYYYLNQHVCQGWRRRDPGIYTKSGEEVLEGRKQIDQCIIASADVFDRLRDPNVTETSDGIGEGDIQQVKWRCQ